FPNLIPFAELYNEFYDHSTTFLIRHPVTLLGLVNYNTEIQILGVSIPRIRSFAYEPSLHTLYFLFPAGMALLFKDKTRLWAIPLLLFCVVSLSGSIMGTVGLALYAWL